MEETLPESLQTFLTYSEARELLEKVNAIHAFIVTLNDAIENHPMANMLFGK